MMTAKARKEGRLYLNMFSDLALTNPRDANGKRTVSVSEDEILAYLDMLSKKPMYRVKLHEDNSVEVICFEMLDNFAPELKNMYESIDELPKWVQDNLAVLMLLDPTQQNKDIENVGRRISENIFWIHKGENDD